MHPYIRGNGGRRHLPSADSTSLRWVSTQGTAVVRGERNPMGIPFPGGGGGTSNKNIDKNVQDGKKKKV